VTEALRPEQWITLAEKDLAMGVLASSSSELAAGIGFQAQQCAERALKALLIHIGADLPRTHDLQEKLSALRIAGVLVPPEFDALDALSPFAVELRYAAPDTVSIDEARHALALARQALDWVKAKIGAVP